jgi:hypothetical protein
VKRLWQKNLNLFLNYPEWSLRRDEICRIYFGVILDAFASVRYSFGPFELDPAEGTLVHNGVRNQPPGPSSRLRVMLVERPER